MTCRHQPGDPNCSSHPSNVEQRMNENHRAEVSKLKASMPKTPDAKNYEIVDVARVGQHLVLKVLYPNCAKCAYEGKKVLVFLHTSEADALRWNTIDPHFRDPTTARTTREAPPPAARFPASKAGWEDAIVYASSKTPKRTP